jgi:ABC-type multidrug transport system ATPase subunit
MIRARRLVKRFGSRRVIDRLDLEVPRGAFLVVTGPNGAGKTTLLRLLARLTAPTAGELSVEAERAELGFLAHEPLVYRPLTALENLDLYGRLYRVRERRERIGMLLALCRTFLHEPDLLLLDEPFNALDADGAGLVAGSLSELRGERTCVVATHEPDRLSTLASATLALT